MYVIARHTEIFCIYTILSLKLVIDLCWQLHACWSV